MAHDPFGFWGRINEMRLQEQAAEKAKQREKALLRFLQHGSIPLSMRMWDSFFEKHVYVEIKDRPRFNRELTVNHAEAASHTEGYLIDLFVKRVDEAREELADEFYEHAHFTVFD